MHATSNPHAPRFHFPCARPRPNFSIFVLRDIQTIGALVPPTTAVIYSPHMAAKNPNKKRKATLDSVLSTVERGFADLEGKMDRGFAAVADDIADIKSTMATKDDIANLGGQLTSVERELKSIRRDLDDLREKVENVSGFQKEIDHALERIAAIEKHLGLDKKIAA
jgi:chromosome segregation ATPase